MASEATVTPERMNAFSDGVAMICLCLVVYLSPGAPGVARQPK